MPAILDSYYANSFAISLSFGISGKICCKEYAAAAVNNPGCHKPPPKAFLMFLILTISDIEPITTAPIGQPSPLVKQIVIVSKQSLI
jgi:hypothetical protein